MKVLYLDIFSGISGDMFIGALLDLGMDLADLERELRKLGANGYHLHAHRSQRSSISGVKFDVHTDHDHSPDAGHAHGHGHGHGHSDSHHHHDHHHHHGSGHAASGEHEHEHAHANSRDFTRIREMIEGSSLSSWVKDKAVSVFRRIAVAEGRIHGMEPEKVHFHEVGAIDSIVDIVGACVGLDLLGRPRVIAAPVVEGCGWVDCAHGRFPVPATATLEILGARGISITQCDEPHELVTPTGAALLAEFAERFEPMRDLSIHRIGYGLGSRENRTRPNVLRAVLGEIEARAPGADRGWETDTVVVLETNLDDLAAEIAGYTAERILAAGALDVFQTPVQMKKNRSGVLLTVLAPPARADDLTELLLRETSAFGVRRYEASRRKLHREIRRVATGAGEVDVKVGRLGDEIVQVSPEFESCRRAAEQTGLPIKRVYEEALRSFHR